MSLTVDSLLVSACAGRQSRPGAAFGQAVTIVGRRRSPFLVFGHTDQATPILPRFISAVEQGGEQPPRLAPERHEPQVVHSRGYRWCEVHHLPSGTIRLTSPLDNGDSSSSDRRQSGYSDQPHHASPAISCRMTCRSARSPPRRAQRGGHGSGDRSNRLRSLHRQSTHFLRRLKALARNAGAAFRHPQSGKVAQIGAGEICPWFPEQTAALSPRANLLTLNCGAGMMRTTPGVVVLAKEAEGIPRAPAYLPPRSPASRSRKRYTRVADRV